MEWARRASITATSDKRHYLETLIAGSLASWEDTVGFRDAQELFQIALQDRGGVLFEFGGVHSDGKNFAVVRVGADHATVTWHVGTADGEFQLNPEERLGLQRIVSQLATPQPSFADPSVQDGMLVRAQGCVFNLPVSFLTYGVPSLESVRQGSHDSSSLDPHSVELVQWIFTALVARPEVPKYLG